MAGIRSSDIAAASGSARVVRAMPNTPALIGRGIAGLYARPGVTEQERAAVEGLLAPTGALLWVDHEADLDAVTALSGSGPAYVFYVLEAMMQAATAMGLSAEQGRALALATFDGATELARRSSETPETLRAQVTSKGGTTFAAISALEAAGVKSAFVAACAFVKAGLEIPARTLAAGVPAMVVRPLTDQEMAWKADGTRTYQDLTRRCHQSLREVAPFPEAEPGRPRLLIESTRPLAETTKHPRE
jgi:hypothetical protein